MDINHIAAEVRAYSIATYGAQLTAAIVDAKHTAHGRGGDVYIEAVRQEISEIRDALSAIEAELGLTEATA